MADENVRFETIEEANRLFAAVEHAKREWETTFDAIEDGIAILTRDGVFKRVNAALAGMVGMDVREMPGRKCCEVFPYHLEMGCPARLTTGHRVVEFEVKTPWKRAYRETSYSVPGLNSVVAIIQDITSQRLAEDRIRRLAEEAVAANRELVESMRVLKATQERLVASEKLASLATMAAGLAHEINNPLGFVSSGFSHVRLWFERVRGFVDAFSRGAERQDLERQYREGSLSRMTLDLDAVLADIQVGLSRIRRIIQAIESFVESGPLDMGPVDMNEVIREAVEQVREGLPPGVEVVTHLTEVPVVQGSRVSLQAMLGQLIENALFGVTQAGRGGRVEVASMERDGRVVVSVRDDGIGMSVDVLSRAVDPFFTTRAPGPHVGLGLTIAQAIVRRHGGDLVLRSTEGEGATVEFTLPVRRPDGEGTGEAPAPLGDEVRKALRT